MFRSKATPAYTRSNGNRPTQQPAQPELGQEHNNLWLPTMNSSRNTQLRTHYGKYIFRQAGRS